jgi:hypothetical protein
VRHRKYAKLESNHIPAAEPPAGSYMMRSTCSLDMRPDRSRIGNPSKASPHPVWGQLLRIGPAIRLVILKSAVARTVKEVPMREHSLSRGARSQALIECVNHVAPEFKIDGLRAMLRIQSSKSPIDFDGFSCRRREYRAY